MERIKTLLLIVLLSVTAGCSGDAKTDKDTAGKAVPADPTRCQVHCHLFYRDLRKEFTENERPPSETSDISINYDFNKKDEKPISQIVYLPEKEAAYHATITKQYGEFILKIQDARTSTMICETSFDVKTIRKRHPVGKHRLSGLTYVPHPTVEGLELQFICTLKPAN